MSREKKGFGVFSNCGELMTMRNEHVKCDGDECDKSDAVFGGKEGTLEGLDMT